MGFAAGNVSFKRYYIDGRPPKSLTDNWRARLAEHAFGQHGCATSDGIETGWIVPTHLFDTDFDDPTRITFERYVYVAMRMDRTAAPAAIVKSYQRMEEAGARDSGDQAFLSSAQRKLAREAAVRRAETEARKGAFRRIAAYPLLIDMQEGIVYSSASSKAAADKLIALFRDTFDHSLTPAGVEEIAYRKSVEMGVQRSFEDALPQPFVDPTGGDASAEQLPGQDRSHLGWEFLTWLWFSIKTREGIFETESAGEAAVAMQRAISMDCSHAFSGRMMLTTDSPATAPETHAALAVGKVVNKLSLLISTRAGDWSLTLGGSDLAVSGLTMEPFEEKDPRAICEYRFDQVRQAAGTIDALLTAFLRVRFGQGWTKEYSNMRIWASGDSSPRTMAPRLVTA